jgi:hypothetical protein
VAEIRPPQPPPKTPDYIKYRHYSKWYSIWVSFFL